MPSIEKPPFAPNAREIDWAALAGRAPDGFLDAPPFSRGSPGRNTPLIVGMPGCPAWRVRDRLVFAQPTPLRMWSPHESEREDGTDLRVGVAVFEFPGPASYNGLADRFHGPLEDLAAALSSFESNTRGVSKTKPVGFCRPDPESWAADDLPVFETEIHGRRTAFAVPQDRGDPVFLVGGLFFTLGGGVIPHSAALIRLPEDLRRRLRPETAAAADRLFGAMESLRGTQRRRHAVFCSLPGEYGRRSILSLLDSITLGGDHHLPAREAALAPTPEFFAEDILSLLLGADGSKLPTLPELDLGNPSGHERLELLAAVQAAIDAPLPEDLRLAFGTPIRREDVLAEEGFVEKGPPDAFGAVLYKGSRLGAAVEILARPGERHLEIRMSAQDGGRPEIGSIHAVRDADGWCQEAALRLMKRLPTPSARRAALFQAFPFLPEEADFHEPEEDDPAVAEIFEGQESGAAPLLVVGTKERRIGLLPSGRWDWEIEARTPMLREAEETPAEASKLGAERLSSLLRDPCGSLARGTFELTVDRAPKLLKEQDHGTDDPCDPIPPHDPKRPFDEDFVFRPPYRWDDGNKPCFWRLRLEDAARFAVEDLDRMEKEERAVPFSAP